MIKSRGEASLISFGASAASQAPRTVYMRLLYPAPSPGSLAWSGAAGERCEQADHSSRDQSGVTVAEEAASPATLRRAAAQRESGLIC